MPDIKPKHFVAAEAFLEDNFRLAQQILESRWIPDELLVLWRGGAPVGMTIHEFFNYKKIRIQHHIIKCFSYSGLEQGDSGVIFENAEEVFASIQPGTNLLIVDDIFDTGKTAEAVLSRLTTKRVDARIAVVYWKPGKNRTNTQPNYFIHKTENWVVFPHEIVGLQPQELQQKSPCIYSLLEQG